MVTSQNNVGNSFWYLNNNPLGLASKGVIVA